MFQMNTEMFCCGLAEIDGVSQYSPQTIVSNIFDEVDYDLAAEQEAGARENVLLDQVRGIKPIILFTGASKSKVNEPKYSQRLCDYIKQNGLGDVSFTEPIKNPNSGNHVTLYVWEVNYPGMLAWWKQRNPRDQGE